jgi:hypothetical protein
MIWLSILQERQGNLPDFGVEHISTPIERSLSVTLRRKIDAGTPGV